MGTGGAWRSTFSGGSQRAAVRCSGAVAVLARRGLAVAALVGVGCATAGAPHASAQARATAGMGLDLYASGEFVLAARRFAVAAQQASAVGDRDLERRALTGQCLAWLRAHRLPELARCSESLERAQRRARRPDPGVNTLVALGAIAGGRPLPPLLVPRSVRPLVLDAAGEKR